MKDALLKVGPVDLHWYGIIVVLALLVGLALSAMLAHLHDQPVDPLAPIVLLGLLTGLLGARVWYVAFNRDFYAPDPARVFAVWEGGLALQGGIVGAVIATVIYTWSSDLDFWIWADICAPGLILGQAIGRIGDLVNNQAFGMPTTGALYVVIPPDNRPLAYPDISHFQPTAAYEGAWDLVVLALLLVLTLLQRRGGRLLPSGTVFLAYLVFYSAGRIPLESMRVDSLYLGTVRAAQLAGIVFIALGALLYIFRLTQDSQDVSTAPIITHTPPSDAYLAAASRAAQPRFSHTGVQPTVVMPPQGGMTGNLPAPPPLIGPVARLPDLPYEPTSGNPPTGESA